jgi:hypothetical protein
MNEKSQRERIAKHLLSGRAITPIDALRKWGCFRLSGRIYELRQEGMPIGKQMVQRGEKRFASYYYAGKAA